MTSIATRPVMKLSGCIPVKKSRTTSAMMMTSVTLS